MEKEYQPFVTKTTAQKRFSEYTPEELSVPKAYGMHAPFKPSEQGAAMRHFRKPVPKEIEI